MILQLVCGALPHEVREKLVMWFTPRLWTRPARGVGSGAFRVYYVCMRGSVDHPCCTLILSKQWSTLHDDHMASPQRWYCSCGARYRTKFGVVCEIVVGPNDVRYCRAECPDYDMKDIKFMTFEEQFGQRDMSPQELCDALPGFQPMNRGVFLQEIPTNPGHYHFDRNMFEDLGPMMEWHDIFHALAIEG